MKHGTRSCAPQRALAVAISGLLILACAGAYSQPASSPQTQQASASDTMRATVQEVNTQAAWIDCLGGYGLALRVTRVHVRNDTRVVVGGATASLAALSRGDIVFVAYSKTPQGDVASEIRKVGSMKMEPGGGR